MLMKLVLCRDRRNVPRLMLTMLALAWLVSAPLFAGFADAHHSLCLRSSQRWAADTDGTPCGGFLKVWLMLMILSLLFNVLFTI